MRTTGPGNPTAEDVGPSRPDAAEIRTWLVGEVAALVHARPDEIDPHEPFVHYGLGSTQALELAAKLEDWIGFPLTPTLIWDYPSIDSLARHLADPTACPGAADLQAERQDDE